MIPAGARPGSREAWTWGEDAFPPIDFAVHALIRDGMRVAPFESHADGDGTLRAGGLTSEAWRAWVSALIDLNGSMADLASLVGGDMPEEALRRGRELGEQMMEPWTVIRASDGASARLRQMWDEYRSATKAWEQPLAIGERGSRRLGARTHRSVWSDLSRLHDRLPTLSVFLVEYPTPAVMPAPRPHASLRPIQIPMDTQTRFVPRRDS